MKHLTYSTLPQASYPICILTNNLQGDEIAKTYLTPFGVDKDAVLVLSLYQKPGVKKTPVKEIKEYIQTSLIQTLNDAGVQYIVCTDAEYFKQLTKASKVDSNLGYVLDSPFGDWKVVYAPSHRVMFHDPDGTKHKVALGMNALASHAEGTYEAPGSNVVQYSQFPKTYFEIQMALAELLAKDVDLAIDIEAFSLKHYSAGIGSICFAWDEGSGIAFSVDYKPLDEPEDKFFGENVRNEPVRALLKGFFMKFKRKAIYHKISFDTTVLIYQLFMKDILDTEGLLAGMGYMLSNWDDSLLITYLATNSCKGNELGLKAQAQEHAGNYAEDEIKDIRKIPEKDLLNYNLIDGCSTWFTYNKNHPIMIQDEQEDIYLNIFKPAILDIVQMQLTGMPVNMGRVKEVKEILQVVEKKAKEAIFNNKLIKEFTYLINEAWVEKKNSEWVKKRITIDEANEEFNPNSGPQLQKFLFEFLKLPVIELTESGKPSTDGETFKALLNHVKDDPQRLSVINALVEFKAVSKLLTSFIPALEDAPLGPDGWHYLFGNFNLGGTVSGRLSSNNPNLQNLPANVFMVLSKELIALFGDKLLPYIKKGALSLGKLIKSCFEAPPGWIFSGLDFASLEDRISALTTKDPNKLAVYLYGFDGHCLRAQSYFPQHMLDIERAPENTDCFKAEVEGGHIYFHGNEEIIYEGIKMTGYDLVAKLSKN